MTRRTYSLSAAALMCLGVLALLLMTQSAYAQRFENVHGDSCLEEGYGGRRLTVGANAGTYISVGVTLSTSPTGGTCATATADIFVVKLNRLGGVIWQRRYDIGGNDIGYDVIETGGSIAICGVTDNRGTGCWSTANPQQDGFIMRLNSTTGAVIWCCTYGSDSTYEGFRRLIQARFAPVTGGTNMVGDLAAAGWSRNPASTTNSSDGYMVRVSLVNGAIVWSNLYGGPGVDDFRSLIETRVTGLQGDFVAVGASNSWNTTGGATSNAWIVRCNGGNGAIGAAPQGSATYGDRVPSYLWSVVELTVNADSGSLVYTGGVIPTNLTAPDIYLLKTRPDPCVYVIDRRIGDNATQTDEASTIRELSGLPTSSAFANGTLYNTGHSYIRPTTNGDVYLMLINPANLTLIGNFHLYGSRSDDGAWYVDYVPRVPGQSTEGFYMTGRAMYVGALPSLSTPPDPDQMYLLKTGPDLYTRCCDTIYTVVDSVPQLIDSCLAFHPSPFGRRCSVTVRIDTIRRWRRICNDSAQVHTCTPPATRESGGDLSNDGGGSAPAAVPEIEPAISSALSVSSFPNPVQQGQPFSLRCDMRMAATLTVTVADVTGRVVYRTQGEYGAGSNLLSVPSERWSPGTYLIKVTNGKISQTRQVVVAEK